MKKITRQELDALCKNGKSIDMQGDYPCVVIHPDDTITKIWAIKKRLLSSNNIRSYAQRFVDNAAKLKQRGIIVPEIIDHLQLENSHVRIVRYSSIPGHSIRDMLEKSPASVDIPGLCQYIHALHEKGIFFRSIHLGNIIQLSQGGYGLIDFTDVKFSGHPVPLLKRAANIAFPLRYHEDTRRIKDANLPDFKESYLAILEPDPQTRQDFDDSFNYYLKR